MKIKNSTQWFNIFSIESKFEVTIKQPRYKRMFFSVSVVVFILLLITHYTLNDFFLASFLLVLYILISLGMSFKKNAYYFNNKSPLVLSLSMEDDGQCYLNGSMHIFGQVSDQSRVSFLGCWLVYHQSNNFTRGSKKAIFIAKNCLSKNDYAKLRRFILSLKCLVKE